MQLKPGAHVHLMGICGTAMGSLAGILKSMGYKVTGSDQNVYPPMSTQLAKLGIPIMQGYNKENLTPRPDLVIVGNVISKNFPEAEALLKTDIPYTSLPKAMGEFVIGHRHSVVIAGTHGKTTTTSMVSWLLEKLNMHPGFMIGGIPLNFDLSFRKPEGDWFVIEGDEYDTAFFDKVPKFIHYRPKSVILTSVEFDHADIYRDLAHVKEAFQRLIKLIPADGRLIAWAEDQNVMELASQAKCKVITYGEKSGDYRLENRATIDGRNHFAVTYKGSRVADVALKQFGIHNSLNALSGFALAQDLGWSLPNTLQAFADFKGVKRRQEIIGQPRGVTVVEDFAHHPTAVKLTIQCMKEAYPGHRVFAIFEPRSATSRRRVFQKQYAEAFAKADQAIIAKPYDQSRIEASDRFSTEELVSDIAAQGTKAFEFEGADRIVAHVAAEAKPGDVVLIMSNGAFDGIYGKMLKALEAR